MKPSAALIVCLLLIASLILPVISSVARAGDLQPLASPPTSTSWSTTAGFDTGAKASTSTATDTCENVTSPALLRLNNTGNYQGIGLTTGTSTCAAGAWAISPTNLLLAYDFTTLRSGKLKDFGPNALDGTFSGAPVAGLPLRYGTGYYFRGHGSLDLISPGVNVSALYLGMNSYTIGGYVNWTWQGGAAIGFVPAIFGVFQGSGANLGRYGCSVTNLGFPAFLMRDVNSNTITLTGTVNISATGERAIVCLADRTANKAYIYEDGVVDPGVNGASIASITGVINPGGLAAVGQTYFGSGTQPLGGIDEVLVYKRAWTAAEIAAFSTDGRSQFMTSGTWTSPARSTPNQIPANVLITYSGATSTRTLTFSILDDLGGTRWTWTGLITSGSSVQIPVGSPEAQSSSWKIRVTWAGGGTGTATVSSLTVEATDVPPIPGGPPIYLDVRCSYNSLLLSWTCGDATDYSPGTNRSDAIGIVAIAWTYDGSVVASSGPHAYVTFAATNATYLDEPRDHLLKVQAVRSDGSGPYATFILRTDQTISQLGFVLVLVLVLVAAIASARRLPERDVYFMSASNPEYKRSAISVEEYPRGWTSYRQRDPDQYHGRLVSKRPRKDLWIVYGLRPASSAERAQTGKKYVAEVQTVRERIR